jgi:hypothetical protein
VPKISSAPFFYAKRSVDYSPGLIASAGHTDAQAPQSIHFSGLITYGVPSLIASTGHSEMQVPQATHAAVILYAIIGSFP